VAFILFQGVVAFLW